MNSKESKTTSARTGEQEQPEDGRARRRARQPLGTGPEAGHVFRNAGSDAPRENPRPPKSDQAPDEGSVEWDRDPSDPAASTGRARPERMSADDEQEKDADLARRGVEEAQSELADMAHRTMPGRSSPDR